MFRIEPQGNMVRHLNTLTALICGIVGSGGANLPRIAQKTPAVLPSGLCPDSKPESRVKRFHRWLKNDAIDCETYFLPFAHSPKLCSRVFATFPCIWSSMGALWGGVA